MRARTASVALPAVALAIALVALGAWRAACVVAGPDVDTDAYAHHMIARAILADPRDLAVHWVWLPLFHYLQVPLVALGGTMNDMRWINVALTAALPVALFAYVRRTAKSGESGMSADATALLAGLFAAACPIAMQMGTTAQPEPLFALLMLGVAIAYERRRYGAAAAMLAAAVVLRYEAWATLATVAALAAAEPWWRRRRGLATEADGRRAWIVVAAPVALILVWAVLRRPVDGRWFGFLRQTHEFAAGATHEETALDGGVLRLARDLLYYPLIVPMRVMGPCLPLVPFGFVRTVREQGARFVLVLASCLGFVSLTWVMRSSLGLDRHFVVVVPLYAVFAAQGAASLADGATRLARRFAGANAARVGRSVAGALSVLTLGGLFVVLDIWMGFWKGSIERGWPQRAELGAYLRTLPDGPTIFCDDATLEILSGVDRRRFDRHWTDDAHTWTLVAASARARGVAYVATWADKLRGHEGLGDIVFHVRDNEVDATSGLAVLRVNGDGSHATR
jgi:hypothetical protein